MTHITASVTMRFDCLRCLLMTICAEIVIVCCRMSEERGWELMWLMTGCFAPSTNLLKEVTLFFRSRSANVLSLDCLGRLQKTLRSDTLFSHFVCRTCFVVIIYYKNRTHSTHKTKKVIKT